MMILKSTKTALLISALLIFCCEPRVLAAKPIIVDHTCTDITAIPQAAIEAAKVNLHIAYGHTSHGSQLTTGMNGLVGFANGGGLGLSLPTDFFEWNNGGSEGALDLHDYAMGGDVGYYPQWVDNTRSYLNNPANSDVNVVIWSWCGQVDSKYAAGTLESDYLTPMNQLEADYPNVTFVYMTGHVDIWDDADNKAANRMIRDFCDANDKVLYDFADIERYDPDGGYYEYVNDNCDYYKEPGGARLGNWATEWQGSHTQGVDWYNCSSAHSQPLNANRKAYAAWWLWARLAGWGVQNSGNHPPVFQSPGDRSVNEGEQMQFILQATDPDGDTIRFVCGNLPDGASLDPVTGLFSWTPGFTQAGVYANILFSAIDEGTPSLTASIPVDIMVTENNRPPAAPDPATPSDGAGDVALSPTLEVNNFEDPDEGDSHQRTRWQISQDADFVSLVFDLDTDTRLYSLSIPEATLPAAAIFFWRVRFFDHHHRESPWSPTRSFTTRNNDFNGNGVPDNQEPGNANMDLDGDGQPDGLQTDAKCLEPSTGEGAITLKAGSNVQAVQALTAVDPGTISVTAYRPDHFPLGLIGFRIRTKKVGDTARVTVYSSAVLDDDAIWYKYDTEGWQDYSANTSIAADRRSVTLTVEDGGVGDADGIANGIIVDPSGPGIFSFSADSSSSGGGCFLNTLLPGGR